MRHGFLFSFNSMAIEKTGIEQFLLLAKQYPVLDVRSPAEYAHAHIPDAHSLPLFTDEERKIVGTAYKQQSRETAIKIGLDFFGPKMRRMVEEAETITAGQAIHIGSGNTKKTVLVHCWRGGMRSAGVAWLLDLYGFKVYTLAGGYKNFRQWVLHTFTLPWSFTILGGFTGSGKTALLYELEKQQQAVVDLEKIACHKGSAFGNLGMPPQPSQEMFENMLALALQSKGIAQHVWLEDESQRIGDLNIPPVLWQTMRRSPAYFIKIPFEERLQYIVQWYGKQDKEKMLNAIIRIKKRLGPLETKTAVNFLIEDNLTESFRVLLMYYDKWYSKSMQARPVPVPENNFVDCTQVHEAANAAALLVHINQSVSN
jgi:tRNA 2-selenouridine synthase